MGVATRPWLIKCSTNNQFDRSYHIGYVYGISKVVIRKELNILKEIL